MSKPNCKKKVQGNGGVKKSENKFRRKEDVIKVRKGRRKGRERESNRHRETDTKKQGERERERETDREREKISKH